MLLTAVVISAAPEFAARAVAAPTSASADVALVPDCERISKQARAYAIAHNVNVCGLGSSTSGQVTTANTVAGTCGSSTITLNKIGGGNTLSVNYGFYSSLGNVIFRSLVVEVGSTGGSVGGWADVSPMNNFVYSTARLQTFPRHATALASLDGTVTLVWGLVCYMKGPKASIYVS